MAKVGFFTPIRFFSLYETSPMQRLLEKVDGYFYLGGRIAFIRQVDQKDKAFIQLGNQSFLKSAFKAASYFTVFLPLIPLTTKCKNKPLSIICFCSAIPVLVMLLTKIVLRYMYPYEIYENKNLSKKPSANQPIDPSVNDNPWEKSPIDQLATPSNKPLAHQPIDLSVIDTLWLNLHEECTVDASQFNTTVAPYIPTEPLTLRQAATDVINAINKAIEEKSDVNPQASIEEKHTIILKPKEPWVQKHEGSKLYFYEEHCPAPNEPANKCWLHKILTALADKNYIQFKTSNRTPGYTIQT